SVRRDNPDAYVIWCVADTYRELIDSNPHVDHTLAVHCLTEWVWFSKTNLFDEVIDLSLEGRMCKTCGIPLKKPIGNMGVTASSFLGFGSLLAVFTRCADYKMPETGPKIYLNEQISRSVDRLPLTGDFTVIHCKASHKIRDWDSRKWLHVIRYLCREARIPVVEVGHASFLQNVGFKTYLNLCGTLSILECAEVIRRARLFVGIDSGPAHLANAVGTKGVILLGRVSNSFTLYKRYTGNYTDPRYARLLYYDGQTRDIPVEETKKAIISMLGCGKKERIPIKAAS
ncbi:glycosyltransferase family 9 protein, partial [Candidatus Omnitrophota bacterium]